VDWKKVAIFGGLLLVIGVAVCAIFGCNKESQPAPIIAKPGQIVVMPPDSSPVPAASQPAVNRADIQRDMERLGRIEANQSR
jgi:hypothetical protein